MELQREDEWRTALGYLPVALRGEAGERRFVMLNGAHGNFCLDLREEWAGTQERREVAWSADVDHYVRVHANEVEVLRWDQSDMLRSSVADVVNNLQAFQQYLESAKAPRDRSVVAHALGIYNRLRSILPDDSQGLEGFLYALHAAVGEQDKATAWSDLDRCAEAWGRISSSAQERIRSDLLMPRSEDKRPQLPLVIRHAMGRIFQEAHNLVMVSPQLSLLDDRDLIVVGKATRIGGAYFTPTPLVRTLVEQCLTPELLTRPKLVILDPACGSGEFLRECVRQLSLKAFAGRLEIVGFDVSEPAVLMARFALAQETRCLGQRASVRIECCDALTVRWPSSADICLMNPPYASWRTLPVAARDALRETLGDLAGPRPDLAFAFLLKGVQCLRDDGLLGAVVPASLLDGDSAAPLRERIDELMLKRVLVRLGNQSIFDEATVDASLYVGQRRVASTAGHGPSLMVWADHASGSSDRALRALRSLDWHPSDGSVEMERPGFSIYSEPSQSAQTWAPRPLSSYRLLRKFDRLPRLSSVYTVKQGTITGFNDAFLLADSAYRKLPKGERRYFRKAIVNSSIRDGRIIPGPWVFFPYGEGVESLDSEAALLKVLPSYAEAHLLPFKKQLSSRAGISNWWHLTRSREVHERRTPKVMSTYFGSAGSFAWDFEGEFVVVQGYVWEPVQPYEDSQRLGLATVAIMSSGMAADLIAAVSNNLAGGQFNLSKRFMSKMPFVRITDEQLRAQIEQLASIGLAISRGDSFSPELRDRLVEDLFMIASDLAR